MAVGEARMAIFSPTPGFKGRTMELSVLNKWVFNFCIGNIPLGERVLEKLEKDIYNEKQAKRLYTQPQ